MVAYYWTNVLSVMNLINKCVEIPQKRPDVKPRKIPNAVSHAALAVNMFYS